MVHGNPLNLGYIGFRAVKLNATQHLDDHLLAIVRNAESLGLWKARPVQSFGLETAFKMEACSKGSFQGASVRDIGFRAEVILRVELFPKGYCIHWVSTWSLSGSNKIFTGVSEVLLTRV